MVFNALTDEESKIIEQKGTEPAFSGVYNDFYVNGFYSCRKCNTPLYRSLDKFNANCGWPSFDDELKDQVKRQLDADGMRTEILCANCLGHLGHVFNGENKTLNNTRHCVNSLSLRFCSISHALSLIVKNSTQINAVVVAGGCFWGVEYYFEKEDGVIATAPGYTGGITANPSYEDVCMEQTHHAEAVLVIYDSYKIDAEQLYHLFFSIHDPSEYNRQGPDIGSQYRSAIFTINQDQADIANTMLTDYSNACTEITPLDKFWVAETKHHHYYRNRGEKPYCHFKRSYNN